MTALGYEDVKIGEYCQVGDGAHASIKRQENGVLYLSSRNFKEGKLDLTKVYYISEEDFAKHFKDSSKAITKACSGDVALSIIGTIGEPYVIKPDDRFGLSSAVAFLRPDQSCLKSEYLYYWLRGPEFQQAVYNIKGGVAQGYVSLEMIRSLPLRKFSLERQDSIVSILSNYDNLIENNNRRIAILEEMAQSLYREWFVKFRFPGHEDSQLVDSPLGAIPEGWELKPFTDVVDVLSGGTPKTKESSYWGGAIPFFAPKDAPRNTYCLSTEKSITEEGLKKCASKLYPKNTVFITARGTVGKVVMPAVDMAMNQSCYALRSIRENTQRYLYLLTKSQVEYLKKNTGGATFDTIVKDTFERMVIANPSDDIKVSFERVVEPLFEQILNLTKRSNLLTAQRDLLLPKLISSQIDISQAEQGAA